MHRSKHACRLPFRDSKVYLHEGTDCSSEAAFGS